MSIINDTIEVRAKRLSNAFGFTVTPDQMFIDEFGDLNANLTDEQQQILDNKGSDFWSNFDLRKVVA